MKTISVFRLEDRNTKPEGGTASSAAHLSVCVYGGGVRAQITPPPRQLITDVNKNPVCTEQSWAIQTTTGSDCKGVKRVTKKARKTKIRPITHGGWGHF